MTVLKSPIPFSRFSRTFFELLPLASELTVGNATRSYWLSQRVKPERLESLSFPTLRDWRAIPGI